MKRTFKLSALLLLIVTLISAANGAEPIAYEGVTLYCVTESDGKASMRFDGFRQSAFAEDAKIVDSTNSGIHDVSTLSAKIGLEPNLKGAKIGDSVGKELGDALIANVKVVDDKIVEVNVVETKKRPTIGVAWAGSDSVKGAQTTIAGAILRNGGRAKFLTKSTNEEDCAASFEGIDGFFMPGGADVNPNLYGEDPYPHGSVGCDDVRDVSDVLTCRWVIKNNLPALWVCRGEQVLNVALGGALLQDVPTELGLRAQKGEFTSEQVVVIPDDGAPSTYGGKPASVCKPAHYRVVALGLVHGTGRHALGTPEEPGIVEDSKFLLPIVGRRYYPSVFTSHHQSADPARIGQGLTIVATAQDGIVEALEYQGNDFALATQFHYEFDTLDSDPEIARFSNSFFQALLEHARNRQK